MLTALSTGHDGSLCTVHAGSCAEALRRIEVLALMSDVAPAPRRDPRADRRRLRPRGLPGPLRGRRPAGRLRRRGRPRGRGPGGPRVVRVARRRAAVARGAGGGVGRPRSGVGGVMALMAALLAFGAAAAAVVGAWELLAAVERTRVAAAWRRAVAPIVRAGREGVSPTVAERRRLGVLAAAVLAAAGWFVSRRRRGAGRGCGRPGDRDVTRARAAAPVPGRAGRRRAGRRPRPRRRAVGRPRGPRRAGGGGERRARRGRPRARARPRGRCSSAPRTEAVLEDLRRRAGTPAWDAMVAGILLQRDAGGDLPALAARSRRWRSRPPRARTATRSRRRRRRASPRGSCSSCRSAPRVLAELAQPRPARRPADEPDLGLADLPRAAAPARRPVRGAPPDPQRHPMTRRRHRHTTRRDDRPRHRSPRWPRPPGSPKRRAARRRPAAGARCCRAVARLGAKVGDATRRAGSPRGSPPRGSIVRPARSSRCRPGSP